MIWHAARCYKKVAEQSRGTARSALKKRQCISVRRVDSNVNLEEQSRAD
jgi:hypothetical protein